jgi:hypothetical protein
MPVELVIDGLEESIEKMKAAPQQLKRGMRVAMDASLLALHESVPPYPAPPPDSTYRRTGTLGRTLGVGGGKPDIYRVIDKSEQFEGQFGTKLKYAPYVIGDVEQARMHRGRWWTMSKIGEAAKDKITQIWSRLVEEIAKRFD